MQQNEKNNFQQLPILHKFLPTRRFDFFNQKKNLKSGYCFPYSSVKFFLHTL
jgi:hypothetical protein